MCALTSGSVNPLHHSEEYNSECLSPRVTKYPRRETTQYSHLQRDTTQKTLYKDGSSYSFTATCEVTHILDLGNLTQRKSFNFISTHCILNLNHYAHYWYIYIWLHVTVYITVLTFDFRSDGSDQSMSTNTSARGTSISNLIQHSPPNSYSIQPTDQRTSRVCHDRATAFRWLQGTNQLSKKHLISRYHRCM